MTIPVLATKLHIPLMPLKVVTRARLINQLDEGLIIGCKLTSVSAPAGYRWMKMIMIQQRFLIYMISALQTISPSLGADILDALNAWWSGPLTT